MKTIQRTITVSREVQRETVCVPADLAKATSQGSGRIAAFVRGAEAAANGAGVDACPYASGRGVGSFRRSWLRGHEAWHKRREN